MSTPDQNNMNPSIPHSHPNLSYSMSRQNSQGHGMGSLLSSQNFKQGPSPSSPVDCRPPWMPSPHAEQSASSVSDTSSTDLNKEEGITRSQTPGLLLPIYESRDRLPPREGHRRCIKDTPLGFSTIIQSSPQLIPIGSWETQTVDKKPMQLLKKEPSNDVTLSGHANRMDEKKLESQGFDELVNLYINLDNDHKLNSLGSGKADGYECSDDEVESQVIGGAPSVVKHENSSTNEKKEGVKRSADTDVAFGSRHRRRFSLDSLDFENEKEEVNQVCQRSPSNSLDGISSKSNLEFLSGVFTEDELRKIKECDKLSKMALSEPKRVKRILANRQSAARSKERKVRYITELEHKVQNLQTETTILSAKLTRVQRDITDIKSENNELKFRLQAMDQQSQLRNALNETLNAEVKRLRRIVAEAGDEALLSSCMSRQLSIKQEMLHLQQKQHSQVNHS